MRKPTLYLALTLLLTPYAAMHAASSDVLTQNPAPMINVPNPEAGKGAKAKAQKVDFETVSMGVRFGFLCLDLAVSAVVAVVGALLWMVLSDKKGTNQNVSWGDGFICTLFLPILTFWALRSFDAFKHAAGMKLVNREGKRLTPGEFWRYVGVKSLFRGVVVGLVMVGFFIAVLWSEFVRNINDDKIFNRLLFTALVIAIITPLTEAIYAAVHRRLPYTKGIYYVKASVYKELQARTPAQENKKEANSPIPAAA